MSSSRPFVGIAVFVVNPVQHPGCVLLSERLSSHGQGSYQLPGGHLEYGESFEECAQRELFEETNLHSTIFQLIYVTNSIFQEQSKHYVTLFLRTIVDDDSELKCMEPEKNSPWIWTKWEDLKSMKLFQPLRNAVDDHNFNPFSNNHI